MTPEEAIEDATEQFTSQGVDLSNISTSVAAVLGGVDGQPKHVVLEALEALTDVVNTDAITPTFSDADKTFKCVKELVEQLSSDKDAKTLMTANNAFALLLATVEAAVALGSDANELSKASLQALSLLLEGQPDLVLPPNPDLIVAEATNHPNVAKLLTFIRHFQGQPDIQLHGIRAVKHACVMHETNRQSFVAEGLVTLLVFVIEHHVTEPDVVAEAAHCLRTLTLDDDVRVAFGKAHDHAKFIVTEHAALTKILRAVPSFAQHEDTLAELCATLARLAVRNEYCQEIVDQGALDLLLPILSDPDAPESV